MQTSYHQVIQSALAENTRIAYEKGWERFVRFCSERGHCPLPATPDTVAEFLVKCATVPAGKNGKPLAMGSVEVICSAISRRHKDAGLPNPKSDPKVVNTLRGLKRLHPGAIRQVKALREYHIQAMLAHCPDSPIGMRDAALLAIGFSAALRRSEICRLQVEDIEVNGLPLSLLNERAFDTREHRVFLNIRKSKTDQEGRGQKVAILQGKKIRPITRLKMWLDASGIRSGFVFQTMRKGGRLRDGGGKPMHHSDIPRIVKHYAAAIGLNPVDYAGHSLRAGFVTSAAAHNARLDKIMEITRHRNPATVLQYIRDADAFSHHAGEEFL